MSQARTNRGRRIRLALLGTFGAVAPLVHASDDAFVGVRQFPTTNNTLGASTSGYSVADLDGDAILDVALAGSQAAGIGVLLGNGLGGFSNPQSSPASWDCTGISLGDLDMDGDVDAVVRQVQKKRCARFLGNGHGGFDSESFVPMTGTPVDHALADLDADGDIDLVVADYFSVAVAVGDGGGGFASAQDLTLGAHAHRLSVGDVNGDGLPDLATADDGGGVVTISIASAGAVYSVASTVPTLFSTADLKIGDLDLDGKPDLAVAVAVGAGLLVARGDGAGGFTTVLQNGPILGGFAIGDVTGDGVPDLVARTNEPPSTSSNETRLSVVEGDGSFGFSITESYSTGTSLWPAIADLNADGRPDILCSQASGNTIAVLLAKIGGGFAGVSSLEAGTHWARRVLGGDLDGDGNPDLAASGSSLLVFRGDGHGDFGPPLAYASANYGDPLASGDFDNDGRLDLVVADLNNGSTFIHYGTSSGFAPPIVLPGNPVTTSIRTADFNLDGRSDIALASAAGVVVQLASGSAPLGFSIGGGFGTGPNHKNIAVGDVNGDGRLDVAVTDSESSVVTLTYGSSTHLFGSQATLALGSKNRQIEIQDLTNDGHPDLVVAEDGQLAFAKNNGSGGFPSGMAVQSVGPGGYAIATGDFDGDGKLDVAVTNTSAYSVSILSGNGQGGFSPGERYATVQSPIALATADFNQDGRLDLAAGQADSHSVTLLLNRSGTNALGVGCPGSGQFVPRIDAPAQCAAGQSLKLSISNAMGGGLGFLVFGLGPANISLPGSGGCSLLVAPLLPLVVAVQLTGLGPGKGATSIVSEIPLGTPTGSFAMQFFQLDAGVSQGYSNSNGLTITIP